MATKKFTQRKAKEMHQLLTQIHSSLQDKNRNKKFMQIPFIEMAWMVGIENCISETMQKEKLGEK